MYRHCRVVFGVSSSPFLLGAVIGFHLAKAKAYHSNTIKLLERSFYVDDLVTSVSSKSELESFYKEATAMMRMVQMNLRCWKSNIE